MGKPENSVFITRKRPLTAFAAGLWACFSAGLVTLVAFAAKRSSFPSIDLKIGVCVATTVFAAVGLINCALCCRNLFYPYAIVFDGDGIYDRTGFVHCGFVRWSDVASVDTDGALEQFVIEDGVPTVRLAVRSPKTAFAGRNILWKVAFAFTQSSCVKLRTLCVNISKHELVALLRERLCNRNAAGGDVG